MKGGLIFRRLSNADERMKSIGRKVEDALRQIARESRMNDKRVRNFGVRTEEADAAAEARDASHQE